MYSVVDGAHRVTAVIELFKAKNKNFFPEPLLTAIVLKPWTDHSVCVLIASGQQAKTNTGVVRMSLFDKMSQLENLLATVTRNRLKAQTAGKMLLRHGYGPGIV